MQDIDRRKKRTDRAILWLPMIIVQLYLWGVYFLFIGGPIKWNITNKLQVYPYLAISYILILIGYYLGIKLESRKKIININMLRKYSYSSTKYLNIILSITLISALFSFINRVGMLTSSPLQYMERLLRGIQDPSTGYNDKLTFMAESGSNLVLLFFIAATSVFRIIAIPVCVLNWEKCKLSQKIMLIVYIILESTGWIIIGTNKGIFDLIFILIFSIILKQAQGNIGNSFISRTKFARMIGSSILLGTGIAYMFHSITSRIGNIITFYNAPGRYIDLNNPLISVLPNFLKSTLVLIVSYLTQGYYGLSLAMQENFTPTYGIGNSWFLIGLYERIFGDFSLKADTYVFKIGSRGWDPYINWHSIYTWFASDYSFIGVLLIVLLFGFLLGKVWKSVLFNQNIFALGLYILFMLMFLYFSANNQIFAFIDTYFAFWILLLGWILSEKVRIKLR